MTTSNGMSSRAKRNPRSVVSATSASATTVADTTVTNQLARLKLSLQARLRVASRLQCSVERSCARTATGAGSGAGCSGCSGGEGGGTSPSWGCQSRSMTQSMQAVSAAMSEGSTAGYIAIRSWLRPSLR